MTEAGRRRVCLSCSILQKEIEALQARGRLDFSTRFLESMLHMAPERLQARLEAAVLQERAQGLQAILVYGDCCPRMLDLESREGVARTRGTNCCELILGQETYRRLRKEGVFFVMPEWAMRWREVFQRELGLDGDVASSFMRDMHTRLVYLDTGLVPVPEAHLAELAAFTGLPCEVLPVTLEALAENLDATVRRAETRSKPWRPRGSEMAAVQFLVTDFLDQILRFSEHPGHMGRFLTHQIRELVGGRIVALVQCAGEPEGPHRLVSITPSRYQTWERLDDLDRLAWAVHEIDACEIWRTGEVRPAVQVLFERMGCNGVLALPLVIGSQRVGSLLVIHLLEIQQMGDVQRAFDLLAPVVAMVMRNSTFFESLETQIRQRTAELERSARQFRSLAQMAPVGIVHMDTRWNLLYTNDRFHRITGVPRAEATLETLGRAVHPDDRAAVRQAWLSLRDFQAPVRLEHRLLLDQDEVHWVLVEGGALWDEGGEVTGFIGVLSDITERKRATAERDRLEACLAQAQKMESVGRLAGGVAHDFNNMLTVILGQAEMVKAKLPQGDPLLHRLGEIERAAGRSRELTQQLLAFSRKQVIAPRLLDVNAHVRATCEGLARLVGEDLTLRIDLAPDLPSVRFDPSQMDQVLLNLVINARDAMPCGGQLTIDTSVVSLDADSCAAKPGLDPGRYVRLCVSDNGSGMDEDTLSRVFEPFFTTKEMGKGTGLGLATVYGVVSQHGGCIDVSSAPGQGTRFEILLPGVPEVAVPARTAPVSEPAVRSGSVLVVEDNDLVRVLVTQLLTELGFRVVEAETAEQALALARTDRFDLLLSDVVMPTMNGRELRDRLLLHQPGLRVLLMSGYTSDVIARQGLSDEATCFIQKPFTLDELARKLSQVLEGGPASSPGWLAGPPGGTA